jgi:hypothetical protein
MSGGGKTQTATQQVQIPPEVMARYNAVNTRAETAAAQPFQAYSQDPSAFVAPLTATQQAGIQNINRAAGMTQPYFQTAADLTMAGSQDVGPLTQQQIGYYQNPFTQSVVGSTLAGLQQQQGQQLAQQQAEAIKAGAFGGDRAGIQRAQLQGQQNLATAQAISPLMMQGYQQGVQTAMGQQNVLAQDLQRQLAAGQQLGGLGAQGQQAALAGAQAQLGAGTAEQQTEQAGKQALYNQFLQERGYPFQVAQFLANIAMGTGALSGSTTQTTQPAPFFSDEREKTNIQPLGDGLYAYDYTADVEAAEREGRPMPPKRVGPMAQDIEERAPGLVGDVNGHKVVDMNSMGGLVGRSGAYASGGAIVAPADMQAILAAIGQPLAFYGGKGGQGLGSGGVGAAGYIPQSQVAQPKLVTAGSLPQQRPSGLSEALDTGSKIAGLAKTGKEAFSGAQKFVSGLGGAEAGPSRAAPPAPKGADKIAEAMPQAEWDTNRLFGYRGGLMRNDYAMGGGLPYATGDMGEDPLQKIGEPDEQKRELMTPGKLGAPAPGLGSQLLDAGSKAASIASMAMMFSDARMKDNIEPVGELYDGQPIYRYNMKGSPKTQLGLMAQDLEHNGHSDAVAGLGGLKMVDYKRATDVAAGLAPRQGYQEGGTPRSEDEERILRAREAGRSPPPGVASGERPVGGVVPPEQIPSRSPYATLIGGMFGRDMKPETKQALTSENLWVPVLAGIGSMLASRSPYLGSAIGEGLVGGTSAYTGLQKQQSEADEASARTGLTNVQAAGASIKYDARGFPQAVLVSDGRGGMRYVPFYEVLENPDRYNLLPQTRREVEQAARTASPRSEAPPAAVSRQPVPARTTADTPPPAPPPSGVQPAREPPATAGAAPQAAAAPAAAPPAATPPAATGPVTRVGAIEIPKEGEYRIDVTPARGGISDEYIRSVLPPGVNINNPRAIEAAINTVPNLRERAEKEAAIAQSIRDASRGTDRSLSDLWSLATSVNRISTNNLTGEGAGQEARAALVNIYNTAAKIAGLPGAQIDVGSDIQDAQIIRKIQELGSVQMAAQGGFNAAAVATSIRNAMPSGNLDKESANTIIANMLVELQKDRDFARYYDAYTRRYGTALNVYDNFNKEMGDRYTLERQRLKESMQAFPITERVNGQTVTRRESAVDILRRDPSSSRRFDARFDTPGLARYWRTN